jgi:hypothetical protein
LHVDFEHFLLLNDQKHPKEISNHLLKHIQTFELVPILNPDPTGSMGATVRVIGLREKTV